MTQTTLWAIGLATHASAQRATRWGGIACLVVAARGMLGVVLEVASSNKPLDHALVWLGGASTIPIIIAASGLALLRKRGIFLGLLTQLILLGDICYSIALGEAHSLIAISKLSIDLLLWIVIVNGIRGAYAIKFIPYEDEYKKTFS